MSEHLTQNRARRIARAKRLRALGYPTYEAYLRSPHWKAMKARFRVSGQPQDCICGERKGLQLHHKTYDRVGEELMTDLVWLCKNCHAMIHALNRRGDYGLDIDSLVSDPKRDPRLVQRPVTDEEHWTMYALYKQGVPIEEIARRLDRPVRNVKRRVRAGKRNRGKAPF